MKREDFDALGELLSKHAQHLIWLGFVIQEEIVKGTNLNGPILLNVPSLPQLEFLHIRWRYYYSSHSQDPLEFICLELIFPDGSRFIKYKTDLPRLKSLTLYPYNFIVPSDHVRSSNDATDPWEECASFYKIFFPDILEGLETGIEVCTTLQRLRVPVNNSTKQSLFPKTD